MSLVITKEEGTGRIFLVLTENGSKYEQLSSGVFEALRLSSKVLQISSLLITASNWQQISRDLINLTEEKNIRQLSIVAFGNTAVLAQNFYLIKPKLIRTMALIDCTARPHPTRLERLIDWLEVRFPLGLPLRGEGRSFNARSHLQRIRCPVLLVTTGKASAFQIEEALDAAVRMPTSWHVRLSDIQSSSEIEKIALLISDFQDIPAKCPQKNRDSIDFRG